MVETVVIVWVTLIMGGLIGYLIRDYIAFEQDRQKRVEKDKENRQTLAIREIIENELEKRFPAKKGESNE